MVPVQLAGRPKVNNLTTISAKKTKLNYDNATYVDRKLHSLTFWHYIMSLK